MEITGVLKMIDVIKDVGSNGFQKRDCVITTDEQYPQHILVQFVQDKVNLLSSFRVGERCRININLRGREWVNPQGEAVYFNTIQGWHIVSTPSGEIPAAPAHNASPAPAQQQKPPVQNTQAQANFEEDPDDLPF